jgi:hypothetical protein
MHYTGSTRAKEILDNWATIDRNSQGDAGRVPPRAGGDGTDAHGCGGGMSGMITSTTNTIEGREMAEYRGIVTGEAILGTNIFRDIFAGIRDIVGGRSGAYEKALREAREIALARCRTKRRVWAPLPLSGSISIMKTSPQAAVPRC